MAETPKWLDEWLDELDGVLAAAKIEEIKRRIERERKARRRKAPSWNPDADPPWRSLEDCFFAALKGYARLSTDDFETVVARGQAWIIGTRDDATGDFLPDRIETLIAAAERCVFDFEDNSILAIYSDRRRIMFKNVRVHWPMLVEALQTAGFEISATSKQARPRGGPPPQATQSIATTEARKRGRKPVTFDATVAGMRAALAEGRLTPEALSAKREKELAAGYGVSRDVARRARTAVLKGS